MDRYYLTKIKRLFGTNSLVDVKQEVKREILKLRPFIKPGARIALAVGSRGVANLAITVKEVAEFIKENRAFPFIIPAMGSHGGATEAGQAEVLKSYGISEETTGIPVRSSMEVVELHRSDSPCPVYMDKNAYESDGIILINRIKPHTDFHSRYESGLIKMAVIGLGKEKQASAIHSFGVYGLSVLIPLIAEQVIATGKILGGIGLVENVHDDTMIIKALKPDEIIEQEPYLLEIARQNLPSLPVRDIDVLVIDQMGKDISGTGIDTNIIGRIRITGQQEPDYPVVKAIAVLDLTAGSNGNAIGIGLADVITKRLYDKIDFTSTYTNVITSSFLERGKVPVVVRNDKEAFKTAFRSCGYLRRDEEKIIRIKDTLHLQEMYVSRRILDELKVTGEIEILNEDMEMFDGENEINPF